MADLLDSIPSPQDRGRAKNLREYVRTELASGRSPKPDAVKALETLNLVARNNGGVPAGGGLPQAMATPGDVIRNSPAQDKRPPAAATDAPDLVTEFAKAHAHVDECRAKGIKPDPRALQALSEIGAKAQATLNPQQLAAAEKMAWAKKAEIMESNRITESQTLMQGVEQATRQRAQEDGKALSNAIRGVTKEYSTGPIETEAQLNDARESGKFMQPTRVTRLNKAKLAEQVKEKYGTSYEEHKTRMDQCIDAMRADPKKGEAMIEKYGFDMKTVENWGDGGLRLGLSERDAERAKDDPDEVEVTLSKEDDISLDMSVALAENHEDAPLDSLDAFKEDHADLLNEDSRHGDLARSFAAIEEITEEASHG